MYHEPHSSCRDPNHFVCNFLGYISTINDFFGISIISVTCFRTLLSTHFTAVCKVWFASLFKIFPILLLSPLMSISASSNTGFLDTGIFFKRWVLLVKTIKRDNRVLFFRTNFLLFALHSFEELFSFYYLSEIFGWVRLSPDSWSGADLQGKMFPSKLSSWYTACYRCDLIQMEAPVLFSKTIMIASETFHTC